MQPGVARAVGGDALQGRVESRVPVTIEDAPDGLDVRILFQQTPGVTHDAQRVAAVLAGDHSHQTGVHTEGAQQPFEIVRLGALPLADDPDGGTGRTPAFLAAKVVLTPRRARAFHLPGLRNKGIAP